MIIRNGDEIIRMGQASVVIEKCILSVPDLFGADLQTDNVGKWLGLKGVVNKTGKVRGQVSMDTCFSKNCGIVNIIFYGQIQKEELFAKLKYEDVVISLRSDTIKYAEIPKIGILKEISPVALKDKSQSIIIPVSGIGNVSTTRKKILQNSLEDELKEYFKFKARPSIRINH